MQVPGISPLLFLALASAQGDGPPVVVPTATPSVAQPRFDLTVRIDGVILAGDRVLFDPRSTETGSTDLERFLADASMRMPKEHRDELGMVCEQPLLVTADENAPFSSVARILSTCSLRGVAILRTEFAVRVPDWHDGQGAIVYEPPGELLASAWTGAEVPPVLDAQVRLVEAGKRLEVGGSAPWAGTPGTRFEHDETRRLEFSAKPLVPGDPAPMESGLETWSASNPDVEILRLSVGEGVTFGEVLAFYDGPGRDYFVDLSSAPD